MVNATRIFEALVQPIGLIWLLNLVAGIWLAYRRRWRDAAFCSAVAALLFVVGSTSVPVRLLDSLERPYSGKRLETVLPCDAVVLLGGTLSASSDGVFHFDLNDAADRAITAAELIRQGKAPNLVIGGGGDTESPAEKGESPEARRLGTWFETWGLTNAPVTRLNISANTREEAVQVLALAQKAKWRRVILVTSGYHMKRAEALFQRLGIPTETVACDFIALSYLERKKAFNPVPGWIGFEHLHLYLHEKIGWFVYRWRGWIG